MEKNASVEASSRASKAKDRREKDEAKKAAKEAAKQQEAERKAASKVAKQKEKEAKRAALKAERQRKMDEAKAAAASGSNAWERSKASQLEKQMQELMAGEDARQQEEDEAVAKLEAKSELAARFVQPGVQNRVPSDQTLDTRRKNRSPSKSAERGTPVVVKSNGALVERDTFLHDRYLATDKYLKTLNRPVGGKLKLFEQKFEEFSEDMLSLKGQMVDGLLYVEVFVWTFHNEATGAPYNPKVRSADTPLCALDTVVKLYPVIHLHRTPLI